ncbi:hypothetical protein [Actinophytocola glycyrrhizae]|uniref:Uncharacterized protein n=1 Tax=Actinophytocola glycyrrhizae TaxID=2044873 RepID=A0ABV9RUI0_9PSEU
MILRLDAARWMLIVVGYALTAYYVLALVMALIREDTAERASMTIDCLVSWTIGTVLLSRPPTGGAMRRARRRRTTPALRVRVARRSAGRAADTSRSASRKSCPMTVPEIVNKSHYLRVRPSDQRVCDMQEHPRRHW